jgi:hypothetical protein
MKLFSHQKPRGFNYIPRHYDPEKERRDARRRELLGPDAPSVKRLNKQAEEEGYTPGQLVRQAHFERTSWGTQRARRQGARTGIIGILGMLALLAVLCYLFIN